MPWKSKWERAYRAQESARGECRPSASQAGPGNPADSPPAVGSWRARPERAVLPRATAPPGIGVASLDGSARGVDPLVASDPWARNNQEGLPLTTLPPHNEYCVRAVAAPRFQFSFYSPTMVNWVYTCSGCKNTWLDKLRQCPNGCWSKKRWHKVQLARFSEVVKASCMAVRSAEAGEEVSSAGAADGPVQQEDKKERSIGDQITVLSNQIEGLRRLNKPVVTDSITRAIDEAIVKRDALQLQRDQALTPEAKVIRLRRKVTDAEGVVTKADAALLDLNEELTKVQVSIAANELKKSQALALK